jgi:Tfp pilus assembly protein PilV
MTRRLSDNTGFTFVELMITLMFLSIAMLAVSSQFPLGLAVSESAEDITLETNLAQELLEEIRTVPWDLIDGIYDGLSENPPQNIDNLPMNGQDGRPNYSLYRRNTTISYADPATLDTTSTPTSLKRIKVSVTNIRTNLSISLVLYRADLP